MKIFILNPLIYSKKKSIMNVRPRQPLGLAYIASLLLEKKHKVDFLDANVLGYNAEKTVKKIKKSNPDILILTSTPVDRWECPNSHIDSVFKVIDEVKISSTILIGSHGSTAPEWIFKKCNTQFVVRGEPDMIVVNLVEALKNKKDLSKIKGISYKIKEKVIHNEDAPRIENLDKLPFPAYQLLPMNKYKYSFSDLFSPFSIMLSSRGCSFNCIFCLKIMASGKYIVRSPENVVREIEHLIKNFNIKSIFFQDWEFTINKERVEKICDLILKKKLKILWGCNARANDLSDRLVKKMKRAGCIRINIGFESGSQKILDRINKGIKVKDLENAIKFCKDNNINVRMYAMLNLPGDNKETIRETVNFFAKNSVDSTIPGLRVRVIPYLGTPLFELLKKDKKGKKFTWDNIENYAGRVKVKHSPRIARLYYSHFKFKKKFGSVYFLNPKFYFQVVKFLINKL